MSDEFFDSRQFLSELTMEPGVYRMYSKDDALLYVGKARNLKKRVSSYFLRASGSPRIESMVSQIRRIEVSITRTEDEALILEANLIKEFSPRYNVMYRDDKSYPYVRFSNHAYPRISYYRGAKAGKDRYFGPFPSASSVRDTLYTLQKLFLLRPCRDSFLANRDRPCLQHQIKRCSAPCVGLISEDEYARDLKNAARLLDGKADELARDLGIEMEQASDALEYERAARIRDQIAALKRVRSNRAITGGADDLDVIACAPHQSSSCVAVVSVRDGLNLGHRSHFPKHAAHTSPEELIESFLTQHYVNLPPPAEIIVSHAPEDLPWLAQAISRNAAGRKIDIRVPLRGAKVRLLDMALATAQQALVTHLSDNARMDDRLLELQNAFQMERVPERLECFDISHTQGERTVASCVVFNSEGPLKSAYRKFNIETAARNASEVESADPATDAITPGDDYAAIAQAVRRRFLRVRSGEVRRPDVLFIDGGIGQLNAARESLDELGIKDLKLVGIAKGPSRKPGLEELILADSTEPMRLPPDSPALHLIQRIRDEAHRFAITGHRGRRDKARLVSELDGIDGLGPVRKRALLKEFGGIGQLRRADPDAIAKVEGISKTLAERIHSQLKR